MQLQVVPYPAQLKAAIKPLTVTSLRSFSWFGTTYRRTPFFTRPTVPESVSRSCLVSSIQGLLYYNFYSIGFPGFVTGEFPQASKSTEQGRFGRRLSAANCSSGYWENGWTLKAVGDVSVDVSRHDLILRVGRDEGGVHIETMAAPGQPAAFRWPKELPMMSPEYYVALGDQNLDDTHEAIVRLYLNVTPGGALWLMRLFTNTLNEKRIPFRFKVLTDLIRFTRSDSGVLYFRKNDYPAVSALLLGARRELRSRLRYGTPALTKPIAMGAGIAESPPRTDSFGLHRCRL